MFEQPHVQRRHGSSDELVIALHCSGSSAAQWRSLQAKLDHRFTFLAPEHYGSGDAPPWTGGPFTCADEAARTLAVIDAADRPVHLVGHSYGGAIALHVAAARPDRIASVALYEPSAFYLLRQLADGAAPCAEIQAVAATVAARIRAGDLRAAAQGFIDYWGGPGSWDAMRPRLQDSVLRWIPKGPLEFGAIFKERGSRSNFARCGAPVLVMRGEHAPAPTRVIADALPSKFPNARWVVVGGAGHMGPVTHADAVNALIVSHIARAADGPRRIAA
jgi:pimeloyl-ACP methyl ester carboxylesterase